MKKAKSEDASIAARLKEVVDAAPDGVTYVPDCVNVAVDWLKDERVDVARVPVCAGG
jgi:hypothetical protein